MTRLVRRNGLSTWSCFGEHEKWVLKNINQRPTIWFRYVDDTFTLFKNKNDALSFLHYLNGRHNNIKFTMEISFLDILLKRNLDSSFSTSVYRKKTFTGLYIKWDPFTPRKYKINLVRTLAYRCIRICSSPRLLQLALNDLKPASASSERYRDRCPSSPPNL